MSVYRKFAKNDVVQSWIHAKPKISVAYGSTGWRGNTGASGSISLYEGVRGRRDVRSGDFPTSGISLYPLDLMDTHSIDKVIFVSGSYPSTRSIRYARCRNENFQTFLQVSERYWYSEHYRPIELLYDFHSRYNENYFLGSYDFYSVLSFTDVTASNRPGPYALFSGTAMTSPTSSWTAEAWIKPLSVDSNPRIVGQQTMWNFFVSSSRGLYLGVESPGSSTAYGTTASLVDLGRWNHVAVSVSGGVSASFMLNGALVETVNIGTSISTGSENKPFVVSSYKTQAGGYQNGLDGFLFETKLWKKARSVNEINGTYNKTTWDSGSADLIHYVRFNDGPLSAHHGFTSGSGAFDYSTRAAHGYFSNYSDAHSFHWQPNDHESFVTKKTRVNLSPDEIRVVHVPSMFYGTGIATGSVRLTCGVYNDRDIVRVFVDDGRGGLYVSGSMTRDISGQEYRGTPWRKVGNVFYSEGLIVLTDPALWDTFDSGSFFWNPNAYQSSGTFSDVLSVDFEGKTTTIVKTFMCRLGPAQANMSNNPTYMTLDDRGNDDPSDDRWVVAPEDSTTYVTAVGLYNEDRQLVAVAKLAQPIRKREKDKLQIRLRMDF